MRSPPLELHERVQDVVLARSRAEAVVGLGLSSEAATYGGLTFASLLSETREKDGPKPGPVSYRNIRLGAAI